jgi:hypothetical protein
MHLRLEGRAKFDICTYPAGFWISNVLGFAVDDTVISLFGQLFHSCFRFQLWHVTPHPFTHVDLVHVRLISRRMLK